MRVRNRSVNAIAMVFFASVMFVSCASETSPLDSMKAPIHVVRNDSVVEVKDSAGKLYTLNSMERIDYGAAMLRPGDAIEVSAKR
ncbi:MAG: hypothetical protein JKX74_04290 [Flavobacteriales bacterium]|nr:hypothetical protein [Flavobacteriales bacterium]